MDPTAATELKVKVELDAIQGEVDELISPDENRLGKQDAQIEVIPCKVCGDKSSGVHYGVITCEGCKGFFRRSQASVCNYQCPRQKTCTVDRINRNRCQYCRLKKCIELGMSRDAVKFGRMSKKQREKVEDEVRLHKQMAEASGMNMGYSYNEYSPPQNGQYQGQAFDYPLYPAYGNQGYGNIPVAAAPVNYPAQPTYGAVPQQDSAAVPAANGGFPEDDIVQKTTRAFVDTTASIFANIDYNSVRVKVESEGERFLSMSRAELWTTFSSELTRIIAAVIEFAKLLNSFMALGQDEQIRLLKCSVFDLIIINLIRGYSIDGDALFVSNQVYPNPRYFVPEEMQLNDEIVLIQHIYKTLQDLAQLGLTHSELALLAQITLLENASTTNVPEFLRTILSQTIFTRTQDHSIFARLADISSDMRMLSREHRRLLQVFKADYPEVELPALYKELFSENIGLD